MSEKKLKSVILNTPKVSNSYARARRAWVNLVYTKNGKKAGTANKGKHSASEMKKFQDSFTFTGCATGEADRIEVVLINSDWRFCGKWMPVKKDKIAATIVMKQWKKGEKQKKFRCGTFLIDSFSMTGPDLTCTVGATSIPETSSFRATEREKSWKDVTLKEVAKKIAARYKMALVFDGEDVSVGTIEQNTQTDCAFLTDLCSEYAYGIKMFKGKLIIYSKARYESKGVVGTIRRYMLIDFDFETNIAGTYTGAKMKYTSGSDEDAEVKVGKGNRWLTVSGSADNIGQAKKKALAALNTENEKTTILNITIRGNTRYSETDTVRIKGLYRLSGKYFIDQVVHELDAESGFTTKLTMHRVQKRIKA
ncbi:MAG: hypothetical protein NC293_09735 [Roseburia sp.]|nr:hypothetical protein [Roseburia sp.]